MTDGILIVYLCAEDQEWILVPSGDGTQDSYTRVIQESYSWDASQTASVGERLTKHEIVGARERRVIPSEWIVTEVESYNPLGDRQGFGTVVLAYCERQPLTAEESEEQSYVTDVQVPAFV
ncbi:MAG: hypothetical protein ACFB9N_18450 [Geitlerinemataceae cyanobacterium]